MPLDCGRRPIQIKQEQLDEDEQQQQQQNSSSSDNRGLSHPSSSELKYGQVSLEPVHGGDSNNNNTTASNSNSATAAELYHCSQQGCGTSSIITGHSGHASGPSSSSNANNSGMLNMHNSNRGSYPPHTKKPKLSPMNWNHVPSVSLAKK